MIMMRARSQGVDVAPRGGEFYNAEEQVRQLSINDRLYGTCGTEPYYEFYAAADLGVCHRLDSERARERN